MADIIPFPKPRRPLSFERENEYHYIKSLIQSASTLREINYCKKLVREFQSKIEQEKV